MRKNKPVYAVLDIWTDDLSTFSLNKEAAICGAVADLSRATAAFPREASAEVWDVKHRGSKTTVSLGIVRATGDTVVALTCDVVECTVTKRSGDYLTALNPETGEAFVLWHDPLTNSWSFDVDHTALHNAKAA